MNLSTIPITLRNGRVRPVAREWWSLHVYGIHEPPARRPSAGRWHIIHWKNTNGGPVFGLAVKHTKPFELLAASKSPKQQ